MAAYGTLADELNGLIDRARAARSQALHILQQAEQDVVAALDAELNARDRVDYSRQAVHQMTAEIDLLLDELAALIPKQQQPA